MRRHAFIHVIEVSAHGTATTIHRRMGQVTGTVVFAKRTAALPTAGLVIGVLHIAWTTLCEFVCGKTGFSFKILISNIVYLRLFNSFCFWKRKTIFSIILLNLIVGYFIFIYFFY